jgi:hypothetical protein
MTRLQKPGVKLAFKTEGLAGWEPKSWEKVERARKRLATTQCGRESSAGTLFAASAAWRTAMCRGSIAASIWPNGETAGKYTVASGVCPGAIVTTTDNWGAAMPAISIREARGKALRTESQHKLGAAAMHTSRRADFEKE